MVIEFLRRLENSHFLSIFFLTFTAIVCILYVYYLGGVNVKVKKVKVTYSLAENYVEALQKESARTGLTMSTIVMLALQNYFKKGGRSVRK